MLLLLSALPDEDNFPKKILLEIPGQLTPCLLQKFYHNSS
jgi:hypothetical protein